MHAGSLLEIQCTRIDHNDVAVDALRPFVGIYCRKHSIRNQKPKTKTIEFETSRISP